MNGYNICSNSTLHVMKQQQYADHAAKQSAEAEAGSAVEYKQPHYAAGKNVLFGKGIIAG